MSTYYGPCRAGLHPEFGWGTPCLNDAEEYVSISRDAGDFTGETLMRLCTRHAAAAFDVDGFNYREPFGPGALTFPRPVTS